MPKSQFYNNIGKNDITSEISLDQGSKILIVDDEKFNCDIIESFLMILGIANHQERSEQCYNGD